MTLSNATVRLIVWCLDCHHQVEPDPAEMAERYGVEMPCPGLALAACVRAVRQQAGRYDRYRDGPPVVVVTPMAGNERAMGRRAAV
jgi:hypothetical protein